MRDRMNVLGMNMARRGSRRALVAATYVALVILWALVRSNSGEQRAFTVVLLATSLFVNAIVFGGYGRWGLVKPFNTHTPVGSSAPWHNDERELRRRDRMHYYAYRAVVAVLLLGFFLGRAPFHYPVMSDALLECGAVLGLTLPQALLLWIEPDMDFEEPEAPAEARRPG